MVESRVHPVNRVNYQFAVSLTCALKFIALSRQGTQIFFSLSDVSKPGITHGPQYFTGLKICISRAKNLSCKEKIDRILLHPQAKANERCGTYQFECTR